MQRPAPSFPLFWRGASSGPRWLIEFADALAAPIEAGDADLFAARAEARVRTLLRCDDARLVIGADLGEPIRDANGAHRVLRLMGPGGVAVGRLEVSRKAAIAFSPSDQRVLEGVGRFLCGAVAVVAARAEAARARADLDQVLRGIEEGMVALDSGLRVSMVTEAAIAWIGGTAEQLRGRAFEEVWPGRAEADLRLVLAEVSRTRQRRTVLARLDGRAEKFSLRIDGFRDGIAVFIRDVSAAQEIEDRLRQAEKLDAIGQLTSGVAHDVNNMLTVMISNLEIMAGRAASREPGERGQTPESDIALVKDALRAGENAAQLISRLVAFARRQPIAPRVVDVAALLLSLEALLRRILSPPVTLRLSSGTALWDVVADPAELESAVLNLALNAQDAMPGGGVLDISAGNVEVDRAQATAVGLAAPGQFVMLTVTDTGTGMSPDVMRHAFEPFFTTKQASGGSGLGLPMVAKFARELGGLATIDSRSGAGTVVRLYLPRSLQTVSAVPAARQRSGPVEGGDGSVLLVEDNDLVRDHTAMLLRGLGYGVTAAADGPQALEYLRAGARPDLLLSDVLLPGGMSGPEVAAAAASIVPGLRVLFTSGYVGDVLLRDGKLPRGVALLTKPFRRGELAARVRAQLDGPPWAGLDEVGSETI